jgi:hypothetical protein
LAGLSAGVSGLSLGFKIGLFVLVLLSYLRFRQDYFRSARLKISLLADRQVEVDFSREVVIGTVLDSTVMTGGLVILHVQTETGQRTVMICRDAVDAESFRLLRVWLVCGP